MDVFHRHPDAYPRLRPEAKYVTRGGKEYIIEPQGSMWSIRMWAGGQRPDRLKGSFISYAEAERQLITYLRARNKFGRKGFYPGWENDP